MLTATKPMQHICFYPVDISTTKENAYVYMFIDAFSRLMIVTGVETDTTAQNIFKHIELLTQDKDFTAHACRPFRLVTHKHAELLSAIDALLAPFDGSTVISDETVAHYLAPAMEHFFKYMSKHLK